MSYLLFISYIILWSCIHINAKPEDLFTSDSNNELTEPVSDDDFISFQSLNNPSSSGVSLSDPAYTSVTPISEHDADSYNLAFSDPFPEEDHSVNISPSLQSVSACENDGLLPWVDDGSSRLQARDDASCTPSMPKENFDSIMNLFQDPLNFLQQNVPKTKAPAGQTDQPGQSDDNLSFETLLNNRIVPLLFEEDGKKCPILEFGLSITPVCLDSLKGSAIGSPGTGFTLHDVEPYTSNVPCPEGADLWCCREITSEVNLLSFMLTLG